MKIDLKPCPFCGKKAELDILVGTVYIIGCKTSGCFGNIIHAVQWFTTKEFAAETWNRRANADEDA